MGGSLATALFIVSKAQIFYTNTMIYFAHRGASAERPQNSVAAFARARALGATSYELDVHLLQDGQLAVHHDYSLLATAGADVALGALSQADLPKYPLLNAFTAEKCTVPLLREVLPLVRENLVCLNIEIKNDGNCYAGIEKVLLDELCTQAPDMLPKILFSSFDYPTLVRLRKLDSRLRIGRLCRVFDIKEVLALQAQSVHMNQSRITPEIIKTCHEHGCKVFAYTVNTQEDAARLAAMGADGIFTDRIDLFVSAS